MNYEAAGSTDAAQKWVDKYTEVIVYFQKVRASIMRDDKAVSQEKLAEKYANAAATLQKSYPYVQCLCKRTEADNFWRKFHATLSKGCPKDLYEKCLGLVLCQIALQLIILYEVPAINNESPFVIELCMGTHYEAMKVVRENHILPPVPVPASQKRPDPYAYLRGSVGKIIFLSVPGRQPDEAFLVTGYFLKKDRTKWYQLAPQAGGATIDVREDTLHNELLEPPLPEERL